MSHSSEATEHLIRNYLVSRAFVSTSKAFEQECNSAKDGNYQVDRSIDELTEAIDKMDVEKVCSMWESWNRRVFHCLDVDGVKLAQQYEGSSYRLLLVKCVQKKNIEKCNEFFTKMSTLTMNNPQWSEWYSLPYNQHARETEPYKRFFDKTWTDIYFISLHNFLSTSFAAAAPTLLGRIVDNVSRDSQASDANNEFDEEMIDDFAVIAQCSSPVKRVNTKPSLRNILKTLTGGSKKGSSD